MPIVLYGASASPPYRAVMLTAKAIGVEIKEKVVDMQNKEHRSEAYMKMNPTHTIPTMDDNGFFIWESRAIMAYLIQQYGKDDKLYPKEPKKRAMVDNMLYFDACCLYASAGQYYHPVLHLGKAADPVQKAVVIERLGFFNTILGQRPYAAGDHLTIADFSLMCTVNTMEAIAIDLNDFPNVKKWADKIKAEVPFYDEVTKEGIETLNGYFKQLFKK